MENGTYTLKLKAELRHSTGGTNRTGIYNPYIVGRKYGHLWGGYNDRPGNREVIAARTFTIIVNETGTNPNGAPMAVNEYAEGASVMAFPNPVNDQLNLRISGMSGATVITITDAEAVNNMIWALFSLFPAILALIMIGLIYIYPIKK